MDLPNQVMELTEKLNSLEKLYEQVSQSVWHKETMFWTVIFGVFTIIGVSLYFLAESLARKGAEKGMEKIRQDYDYKLLSLEKKLIKHESLIEGIPVDFITESGIWTPEVSHPGYEYYSNTGKYYRLGDMVVIWFDITISNFNNDNRSNYNEPLGIKGIPFASSSEDSCDIITIINRGTNGNQVMLYKGYIKPMKNIITIYEIDNGNNMSNLAFHDLYSESVFEAGTQIKGTLMYKI